MKFNPPFQPAKLVRRYKRFLADVEVSDGGVLTIHCPNTGSMMHCNEPGSRIWYSTCDSKTRKYPNTFEVIEVAGRNLAGINTGRANALVREAVIEKVVPSLSGYAYVQQEVKYGKENSRIDFLLRDHPERPDEDCYVEVKNVTLCMDNGLGLFPDAVSTRGSKHLRELMRIAEQGNRAVLFFCVQHTGIDRVEPAVAIDPNYSATLDKALACGVEVMAWRARIGPKEIRLVEEIPVVLPRQS
jgi:sugar fermentation stimulation protein A